MNYGNIKKYDIADGPGVRVSLFVSGCRHHCRGCFNPETWNFSYGKLFTEETAQEILEALKPDYIRGFTLLGGEPFEPENQPELAALLEKIRKTYPKKDIWCYTGCLYEKDLTLLFRGSANQRLLTLREGKRVGLWNAGECGRKSEK